MQFAYLNVFILPGHLRSLFSPPVFLVILPASLLFFHAAYAESVDKDCKTDTHNVDLVHDKCKRHRHGYKFYFEQDAFTFIPDRNEDRDYTQGTFVEWYGRRINDSPYLKAPLNYLDRQLNKLLKQKFKKDESNSFTVGLKAYTPEQLDQTSPIHNDHPFASYLFITDSKTREFSDSIYRNREYLRTSFTLGTLGNSLAKDFQFMVHQIDETPSHKIPNGWDNQIDQDLVFNYQLTHITNKQYDSTAYGFFWGGNIGNIFVDAYAGLSGRWGIFTNEYVSIPGMDQTKSLEVYPTAALSSLPQTKQCFGIMYECYLFSSVSLKAVYSNRLIEGYSGDRARCRDCDLEPVVGLFSFGFSLQFTKHTNLTIAQHIRSNEFESTRDDSDRNHYFGGIYFTVDNPF